MAAKRAAQKLMREDHTIGNDSVLFVDNATSSDTDIECRDNCLVKPIGNVITRTFESSKQNPRSPLNPVPFGSGRDHVPDTPDSVEGHATRPNSQEEVMEY